jgi:hypothetical protein
MAHIAYSSQNATRVTVNGVDSALYGLYSRLCGSVGSISVNLTAYGMAGSTPATVTARIVVMSSGTPPPPPPVQPVIECGPDKQCVAGSVLVPYKTTGAEQVIVSLVKDGTAVSQEEVATAERSVQLYEFTASEGVYSLTFEATAGALSAEDQCTITCGTAPMLPEEYELWIMTPETMSLIGAGKTFEVNALLFCDLDVTTLGQIVFTQTGGAGTLNFGEGQYATIDENYLAKLGGLSYTLAPGSEADMVQITATTTVAGVVKTDFIILGVIQDYLTADIVPSVHRSTSPADDFIWTFDAVITANDADGVVSDFARPVSIKGEASPRGNWVGRTDIEGRVTAYCPGSSWDDDTAVPANGSTELPATAFSGGSCVARITVEAPVYVQDLGAPYDQNSAWIRFFLTADIVSGSQMAFAMGGADLLGADTVSMALPAALDGDLANSVTISAADAVGVVVASYRYAGTSFTVTAKDSLDANVELSLNGTTFGSSVLVPYGVATNVYIDSDELTSPITLTAVLSSEVEGYSPYGSETRDIESVADEDDIDPPMTWWEAVGESTPTFVASARGDALRAFACHSTVGIQTRGTVFINDVASAIMWVTGNGSWTNYVPFDAAVNIEIGDEIRIAITQADYDHNLSVALQGSGPWYCNMNRMEVVAYPPRAIPY